MPRKPSPRRSENPTNTRDRQEGGRFADGNGVGKAGGRPKKDWDIETEAKALTPPILRRFAQMGANARTPHDVAAGKVVIAYAEGLPRARNEHSGPGGGPIPLGARDENMTTEEMRRKLALILAGKAPDAPSDEAGDGNPNPFVDDDGEE